MEIDSSNIGWVIFGLFGISLSLLVIIYQAILMAYAEIKRRENGNAAPPAPRRPRIP